jgi:hypothetical protein
LRFSAPVGTLLTFKVPVCAQYVESRDDFSSKEVVSVSIV